MFRVLVICNWLLILTAGQVFAQNGGETSVRGNYLVQPVSVNTPANDYSPQIINGKLYFTSDRRERVGAYFSAVDSIALSNIYTAAQQNDTLFGESQLLDNRLNRFYNSGPSSCDEKTSTLYFSANEETSFLLATAKEKSKLKIWSSQFSDKSWQKRKLLSLNSEAGNFTHPFWDSVQQALIFASDIPGGSGGFDLYISYLKNGEFSKPETLGPGINTPANELFPSVFDGTLYFSSERKGGSGKLDLYAYRFADTKLSRLEEPFNSPGDDFGMLVSDDRKGYFTSGRSGNDEIYFYTQLFPDFRDCEPYVKDKFCFTFFEETEEFDEGMDLEFQWSMGDGTIIRSREAKHCFPGYGEYLVELNIIDKSTNAVFFQQSSYPFPIEPSEKLHIEGPDSVLPGQLNSWSAASSILPGYTIENFYWQLDNGSERRMGTDSISLQFDKSGVHELLMGVTAVNDETAISSEFCITRTIVSDQNAKMYIPYVRPVVIDSAVFKESEDPVAEPQYTLYLGVSDSLLETKEMYNRENVRVENLGDSLYVYSVGVSEKKSELIEEFREARQVGFSDSRVTEISDGKVVNKTQLAAIASSKMDTVLQERITREQIAATSEIFYATDVSQLTAVQKEKLKELLKRATKSKDQHILIASFTDRKGNDAYNLQLSKNRSDAVRNELIAYGFPEEKIELEYYGRRVPQEMEPFSDAQRRKSIIIIYEKK